METGAWCAMSMGLQRDTAEHVCTSQLQDGLVREGGAALPFAPSGIPLELKQERWAAEALLPVNKKKRGRGFQRADEPYPSRVSSLPCCVEGKEVKRESKSPSSISSPQATALGTLTLGRAVAWNAMD